MMDNEPRHYPDAHAASPGALRLHELAAASLAAETGQASAAFDQQIRTIYATWLDGGAGAAIADSLDAAPTGALYRHLWRLLAEQQRSAPQDATLATTVFAIPVVVVAGRDTPGSEVPNIAGVLDDIAELEGILRTHGALGGNQTFGLGNVLVAADILSPANAPNLHAWRAPAHDAAAPVALSAAPIVVAPGVEGVHLRFLMGTALAAPGVDLLAAREAGKWGMPLAQALARQLQTPGVAVLALPRRPRTPLEAAAEGRAAQREVGAQIFASNAIRKLRAAVGEPTAVISVHRVPDAYGVVREGEVRLSLSSPFDTREAEGFRWPLAPLDRVADVILGLSQLMQDCRVTDIRIEPGIHPDRDTATGLTLLFKGENASSRGLMH